MAKELNDEKRLFFSAECKISSNDIRFFLRFIEKDRKCGNSTVNQRLSSIHSFVSYVSKTCPEFISWANEILAIPFKKSVKPELDYLEKNEMDEILNAPDTTNKIGLRDYTVILLMYNTGVRASEVSQIKICDLNLSKTPYVKIMGKGRKVRHCPLWSLTVKFINLIIESKSKNNFLFLNCRREPITRFGIYSLVKKYAKKASKKVNSISNKNIGPHSIRHTTAVHLVRSGVDINTIRAWLGHVSISTTNIYATIDLEMKTKALSHCEIVKQSKNKKWKNRDTMNFLKNL